MSDLLTGTAAYGTDPGQPVVTNDSYVFLIEQRIAWLIGQGHSRMEAVEEACGELAEGEGRIARCGSCAVFRDRLMPGRDPQGYPIPLCEFCTQ